MENTQVPLFVEDLNEAIRATVNSLGGFKVVGVELRRSFIESVRMQQQIVQRLERLGTFA